MIAGDAEGFSDALLGIFDAIAPAASAALAALAAGDRNRYAKKTRFAPKFQVYRASRGV